MSRATAATHGPAAAVKEAELHIVLTSDRVQGAMRFVNFPDAGEHATVFVGIGVAEHHFLPARPGIQKSSIFGLAPYLLHYFSRSTKRVNGLE